MTWSQHFEAQPGECHSRVTTHTSPRTRTITAATSSRVTIATHGPPYGLQVININSMVRSVCGVLRVVVADAAVAGDVDTAGVGVAVDDTDAGGLKFTYATPSLTCGANW